MHSRGTRPGRLPRLGIRQWARRLNASRHAGAAGGPITATPPNASLPEINARLAQVHRQLHATVARRRSFQALSGSSWQAAGNGRGILARPRSWRHGWKYITLPSATFAMGMGVRHTHAPQRPRLPADLASVPGHGLRHQAGSSPHPFDALSTLKPRRWTGLGPTATAEAWCTLGVEADLTSPSGHSAPGRQRVACATATNCHHTQNLRRQKRGSTVYAHTSATSISLLCLACPSCFLLSPALLLPASPAFSCLLISESQGWFLE